MNKTTNSGLLTVVSVLLIIGVLPSLIMAGLGFWILSFIKDALSAQSIARHIESLPSLIENSREFLYSLGINEFTYVLDELAILLNSHDVISATVISTTANILLKEFFRTFTIVLLLHLVFIVLQLIAGIIGIRSYKNPHLIKYCKIFAVLMLIVTVVIQIIFIMNLLGFEIITLILGLLIPGLYLIGALIVKEKPVQNNMYYPS